jgi:predicted transposase/invertase (TIGR01784 family)
LNELPDIGDLDDAVGVLKLLIEPKPKIIEAARNIITRAPARLSFIEQVLFYAFSELSREEILKMLSIQEEFMEELKKTRAYQDILKEGEVIGFKRGLKEGIEEGRAVGIKEGKFAALKLLRQAGFSDEVIAEKLNMPLNDVKRFPHE